MNKKKELRKIIAFAIFIVVLFIIFVLLMPYEKRYAVISYMKGLIVPEVYSYVPSHKD